MPPRLLHVRPYTSPDRAEWLRMRQALWPEIERDTSNSSGKSKALAEADADLWLTRAGTVVLVADRPDASGLAGFAEVGPREYADGCDTAPVAYLEAWYVDPDLRGHGVGASLIHAAAAWAHAQGFAELASDALLENTPAQHAHLALGFEEVERSVKYRRKL